MANLIDEIVSQKAFDELQKLKNELAEAQKAMEEFIKVTGTKPNFGGGQSLSELDKLKNKLVQTNEKVVATSTVYGQLLKQEEVALADVNNELKTRAKLTQAEEGSINQLRASLNLLTKQYESMGKAAREGLGGKELHARIMATRTEVDKLEQSLGNYKRNVGNYTNATFQLSQVFRELPAFTFSATTGIMALSNNLPMLGDAFVQVKKETGSTLSALGVFGKSIFSLGNVFTIAISLLTIFSEEIIGLFSDVEKATKGIDDFTESADALNYALTSNDVASAISNIETLKIQVDLAKQGFIDKKDVVELYNSTLGDAMGTVTDLAEIEQKLIDGAPAYIQMLIYKAAATAALDKAGKELLRQKKFEREFEEVVTGSAEQDGFWGSVMWEKRYYDTQNKIAKTKQDIVDWKKLGGDLLKMAADISKQMGFDMYTTGDEGKDGKGKKPRKTGEVDRIDIIRKEFEREKALIEQRYNDGFIEEANYYDELIQLSMKYTSKRDGLSKKEAQTEAKFNEELSKIRFDSYNSLLEGLKELDKDYNKMLEDLEKKTVDNVIKQRERRAKHNEYWSKVEIDLIKENIKAMEDMWEKEDQDVEKNKQKALERLAIVEDYFKQFQELAQIYTDAINAKESSAFDIKTEKMKEFYDEEEQRINRSYTNQKDREIELQKLSARKRADEKALDIERKKMLKEQAMRQKKADVMAAISGAALMIIKQSIATPLPTGLPFILAAGVTGGLQVAKAMAAPIPEFAKGTESSPEGYAVVGEKGHELVIEPSGKKWVTPAKDTITYLRKGSKVIPNDKLMTMVRDSAYVELANMNMPITPDLYGKALIDQFDELANKVDKLSAIMSNKDMRVNIVGNFDHYMHVKRNIK